MLTGRRPEAMPNGSEHQTKNVLTADPTFGGEKTHGLALSNADGAEPM